MKINYLDVNTNKSYEIINEENPFKKGSVQYYLINYLINNVVKKNRYGYRNDFYKYISKIKEVELGLLSKWNLENLYENMFQLGLSNNIIKIKSNDKKFFGLYFEDGMVDVLSNENYTNHLPIGNITSNHKLLWLSLYMNQYIREQNKVLSVKLNNENKYYSDFNIEFKNYSYSKLAHSTIEIPFSAYSQPWHSKDWICLETRGLFHHIGDNISFFYGANEYLDCYFIGRNQYNQITILSDGYLYNKKLMASNKYTLNTKKSINSNIYQYNNKSVDDVLYAYGVNTGVVKTGNTECVNKNFVKECEINSYENYYNVEQYWENDVFLKNASREMKVMSIKEKFIEILEKFKPYYNEKNQTIINKIIKNQKINNKEVELLVKEYELIKEITEKYEVFFIKSLGFKTVCEIINPPSNLDLGFFNKIDKNKEIVNKKEFKIINELNKNKYNDKYISKSLDYLENNFINNVLKLETNYIDFAKGKNSKIFTFSEVVSMKNEYRMFVINNRVVATSACYRNTVPLNAWNNGRFDPRLVNGHNAKDTYIDRKKVYLYAKFANKFNKEMKEKHPNCKNYVLDVAWCEEKNTVVPIELNSITWSGAYQINMHRLCAAISGNKFRYEDLELFFTDKCHFWIKLIEDKKINKSMFDLCGLERTFKANTLKGFKKLINETKKKIKNIVHV